MLICSANQPICGAKMSGKRAKQARREAKEREKEEAKEKYRKIIEKMKSDRPLAGRCTIKAARQMSETDSIKDIKIVYNQEVNRYFIQLSTKNSRVYVIESDRGTVREFASIDTAFNTVEKIQMDKLDGVRVVKRYASTSLPPY